MTREEAIKILKTERYCIEDVDGRNDARRIRKAYDMAIETLSEPSSKSTVTINSPISFASDVVSVVRCKDCDRGFGSPVCPIQSQGWAINKDTFYCAWGERREE